MKKVEAHRGGAPNLVFVVLVTAYSVTFLQIVGKFSRHLVRLTMNFFRPFIANIGATCEAAAHLSAAAKFMSSSVCIQSSVCGGSARLKHVSINVRFSSAPRAMMMMIVPVQKAAV